MKILLVAYDNDSNTPIFPMGLAYISSVCRKHGHEVRIYNQDVYHWPYSHLTELLNKEKFDVIGMGSCGGYYQYRQILNTAEAINRSKNKPIFLLGGHLVSPEPEYFLKKTKADVLVIGEGEETIIELLDAVKMKRSLSGVKGIAYMNADNCIQTPRRSTIQEINKIPFPAWDLFPMDNYTLTPYPHMLRGEKSMFVLTARGCPFQCNFCYRMDKGYRPRKAEGIVEEVRILKKNYNVSYVAFLDELFMGSIKRTTELCESFIKAKLNIKWFCSGRLNYAKPEVLRLMKEAGCVFISYGIESLDDNMLKIMHKVLTVKQIAEGVENTIKEGISPGFNIIFGNIGETVETLQKGVEFLLKYDDHAQLRTIRPVTPYPGSPLYYYAIKQGLLKGIEDFYENKHINSDLLSVNFTNLSERQYYKALYNANLRLLDNYYGYQKKQIKISLKKLYFKKDTAFRGFRRV
ncbi:MAG: radical SAM protein [Candidatus Omnitrophica bacterium]|nr:radical SAM protein [Candidatus Omnitrophota bacterium]